MSYKCENCGVIKENGELYYQVKVITSDGQMRFIPTCSGKCAETLKNVNYRLHKNRAEDVQHQCFQRMKWED